MPTSPPCTSPPPLLRLLALATLQAAQDWKGFFLFLSCLSEVNSHSAICIEAPTHPALMHATIFGNVVSIVGRMYGRRAEYDKKVRSQRIYSSSSVNITKVLDLEYFARLHKLPKDVRQRSSYYSYENLTSQLFSRMVDHLQTKWFFNRGLDNKVRLGGGGG